MILTDWEIKSKPRRWQEEALELWRRDLKGVVSVVTGGGKTIFAEMCMLLFMRKYPNGKIIIVVPTIALLDQWYVSLRDDLGVNDNEISCFSGQDKPTSPSIVNVLVINTARTLAPEISRDFDTFLIVDECHRAGSPENSRAILGYHKASLGLSATPKREYDKGFEDYVVPSIGDLIFEYDYIQARKDGVIVNFDLINVRVDLLPHEQNKFDALSKKIAIEIEKIARGRGSEEKLKILLQRRATISSSAAMRIPVTVRIVEGNRGKRTVIFHERIEAANTILSVLNSRNHSATIYHSKVHSIIRRDNLRLFKRGIFDCLVTCKALDEGLNIPESSVAIISSSTASTRQRIQRLGRVLRPAPGKYTAEIYTLYATDQEESRLINEAKRLTEISSIQWLKSFRE